MSRRTADAAKAIRIAWEKEQKLVVEGKGTRDWTPDQQRDILESGKAHDADGKAFEGQHMKSAAEYPEYQGDPENIQFLTHQEHLEAHKGSWQNPTNWYYDPVNKEYRDFGDGKYIPCEVIELSIPIGSPNKGTMAERKEPHEKRYVEEAGGTLKEKNTKTDQSKSQTIPKRNNTPPTSPLESEPFIIRGFHRVVNGWRNFESNHPFLAAVISEGSKMAFELAANYGASKVIDGSINKTKVGTTSASSVQKPTVASTGSSTSIIQSSSSVPVNTNVDAAEIVKRASPCEHIVIAKGQHYNTKEGRVWIEKAPYSRGKPKEV
jgi:hypothetical protein